MIDIKRKKPRRLSGEILGLIGISAMAALILFLILTGVTLAIVESYCFDHDIWMTEYDWIEVDRWIFGLGAAFSVASFSILFLSLLHDRIVYIRTITKGIEAMREGTEKVVIPLEGCNELTELAVAICEMSETRKKIREKEQEIQQEKEQFIRTLSHDIRTPLTAILSYSEYLTGQEMEQEERQTYLKIIQKKAEQIRELTDLLLDGNKRNPEWFEDGRLLLEQIGAEMEEELEDHFSVKVDVSSCPAFSGTFDVQELRRIFDNLSSNIQKYADPKAPVTLAVGMQDKNLKITQTNGIRKEKPQAESYQIGINSIRRIAQFYHGQVKVEEDEERFSICITLSEF